MPKLFFVIPSHKVDSGEPKKFWETFQPCLHSAFLNMSLTASSPGTSNSLWMNLEAIPDLTLEKLLDGWRDRENTRMKLLHKYIWQLNLSSCISIWSRFPWESSAFLLPLMWRNASSLSFHSTLPWMFLRINQKKSVAFPIMCLEGSESPQACWELKVSGLKMLFQQKKLGQEEAEESCYLISKNLALSPHSAKHRIS